MFLQVATGVGGEVRQFGQGQVDLDDAAPRLPVLDVGDEVRRQVLLPDQIEERGAWMQRADDRAGPELVAARQGDSYGPAVLDQDAADRGVEPDLRAESTGGPVEGVGARG